MSFRRAIDVDRALGLELPVVLKMVLADVTAALGAESDVAKATRTALGEVTAALDRKVLRRGGGDMGLPHSKADPPLAVLRECSRPRRVGFRALCTGGMRCQRTSSRSCSWRCHCVRLTKQVDGQSFVERRRLGVGLGLAVDARRESRAGRSRARRCVDDIRGLWRFGGRAPLGRHRSWLWCRRRACLTRRR